MPEEDFVRLMEIWVRIVSKMNDAECKRRDYGTGDLLSPSEIHLLQAIGRNQGKKITDLATYTGVTKGAVSQMANKLTARNLVVKYSAPGNEKEVLLKLTKAGKTAQKGHDRHHEMFVDEVVNSLGELTDDQVLVLEKFLTSVEKCIDDFNAPDE
jgi:DNA-binding MarR family transcriptional regulator